MHRAGVGSAVIELQNREINAGGTTVLVATHDRALIAHVGRRVLHLEQGRVPAVPA